MAAGSAFACLCGVPLIAVSMGDPVGIGPEVVLKGFSAHPRRVHVGVPWVFRMTAAHLGLDLDIREVGSPEEAELTPPTVFSVVPVGETIAKPERLPFGQFDPRFAPATIASIGDCCRLALEGRVRAMVTPPIHKRVLYAAGHPFPGHTEFIASIAGVDNPVMMLVGKGLRVVPLTIHQSLVSVSSSINREKIESIVHSTWRSLIGDFGVASPRVTVAGLNPHAGEGGVFGREEIEIIGPACDHLRILLGPGLRGPLPADTLFHQAARHQYDAVILMYHDQALIPLKMLAFGAAVNVTLGLPFVRTSVDHGTAYDISGQGRADVSSFREALQLAETMANHRQKGWLAEPSVASFRR
ncbi:MAG: 4-hydroxythreonine-4-phosphate dehydrogenase PdxA [Magnetococcales bacterium]|nr:4-hydroxythreonine-4-phosphate dehydrogenase PdxA [Magnetococcales bacterium]